MRIRCRLTQSAPDGVRRPAMRDFIQPPQALVFYSLGPWLTPFSHLGWDHGTKSQLSLPPHRIRQTLIALSRRIATVHEGVLKSLQTNQTAHPSFIIICCNGPASRRYCACHHQDKSYRPPHPISVKELHRTS
jgi:hypothetical protein